MIVFVQTFTLYDSHADHSLIAKSFAFELERTHRGQRFCAPLGQSKC